MKWYHDKCHSPSFSSHSYTGAAPQSSHLLNSSPSRTCTSSSILPTPPTTQSPRFPIPPLPPNRSTIGRNRHLPAVGDIRRFLDDLPGFWIWMRSAFRGARLGTSEREKGWLYLSRAGTPLIRSGFLPVPRCPISSVGERAGWRGGRGAWCLARCAYV